MAHVLIHEVGPRDGLQAEKQVVPTEIKLAWLSRLLYSGVDIVQVGSFVHPEKVPQMADTDELFLRLSAERRGPRAVLSGLVLNEKGLERGLKCGVELFCLGAGLDAISLADTAGHAHPAQVAHYVRRILAMEPAARITAHIHNTYGLGMANVYAALDAGATSIETSFGGLGGCPFTRVAAGNVATEDVVHGLQRAGHRTDIKLDVLIDVARDVAKFFGRDLPGCVYRIGPIKAGAPGS